jgi:hypothetical protein
MSRKLTYLKVIFLSFILVLVIFTGCVENNGDVNNSENQSQTTNKSDLSSILPDWEDGNYHDYSDTIKFLNDLYLNYPDLVDIFRIGKSVIGKEIKCIRISNDRNKSVKYTCLIDGCIHGSEWEAGEACLYLAEYLLINFENNITISNILNKTIIYIVPLVNPDGRDNDDRFNENGIDLNRNFDIDFGRLRGHCMPIGKILGRKIPYLSFPRLNLWFTNSGRRPFSEPETQAIRNLMRFLDSERFSFYMNCHTATHSINTPWSAFKHPFELTSQESNVYDAIRKWVSENTEYEDKPLWYKASGTASDWSFKEFRVPSVTFEILSMDYEPGAGGGRHDNLVHWMKTTIPVFMFMLVNVENLFFWEIPDNEPALPEGVPPEPLG